MVVLFTIFRYETDDTEGAAFSSPGATVSTTVCLADMHFRRRAWSNHELAQFHRMIANLSNVGFALETDSGVTDEGDPWFVFCDGNSDEIFAHFARISGEYVVCAPCLDRSLTRTTLRQLVDAFIDLCPYRHAMSTRSRSNPAAR